MIFRSRMPASLPVAPCIRFLLFATTIVVILWLLVDNSSSIADNSNPKQQHNNMADREPKNHGSGGVICFGDSLTAGTSGMEEFPYANSLRKALEESLLPKETLVQHYGLPGWTAQQLLSELDHPTRGLRTLIRAWPQSPPLSLVILLAGTNDLGLRRSAGAERIANDVIGLHRACLEVGVPQTLAIAIPSSHYQESTPQAAQLAAAINQKLRDFANEKDSKTTFVDFPFPCDSEHEKLWNVDGLHFSKEGYETLGRYLAPFAAAILKESSSSGQA